MTLTELLPINESLWQGAKTLSVNARDLHRALEIGRMFSHWIKARLSQADFVENQDFYIVQKSAVDLPKLANQKGGDLRSKNYWLSLDTAKHICLMDGDRPLAQTVVNYLTETQKQNVKEMMTPETTKALVFPHKFHNDLSAMTTSLFVADFFGKRHKNILQAIQELDCSEEFRQLNFQPAKYKDEQGKPRPMVRMTRDGFTFLAMGFTGKKAAQFKEAYIHHFNQMERWITKRKALSGNQHVLNEAIQYLEQQTGKRDEHAYSREQNLVYLVAIGASRAKWLRLNNLPADDEIRQHLTAEQIALIDLLQSENAVMIKLKMDYSARKNQLKDSALHYWQTHHRQAA